MGLKITVHMLLPRFTCLLSYWLTEELLIAVNTSWCFFIAHTFKIAFEDLLLVTQWNLLIFWVGWSVLNADLSWRYFTCLPAIFSIVLAVRCWQVTGHNTLFISEHSRWLSPGDKKAEALQSKVNTMSVPFALYYAAKRSYYIHLMWILGILEHHSANTLQHVWFTPDRSRK